MEQMKMFDSYELSICITTFHFRCLFHFRFRLRLHFHVKLNLYEIRFAQNIIKITLYGTNENV